MRIAAMYRYPLKGFPGERLQAVMLAKGGHMPADRLFAIENGPSGFDPAAPVHQPKQRFLQLMTHPALARIETQYHDTTDHLTLRAGSDAPLTADMANPLDCEALCRAVGGWLGRDSAKGPLAVLRAPGGMRFTDSPGGHVSLINLASLADLEQRLGAPLDPRRFRANLVVDGLPAWAEFTLTGQRFQTASGLQLTIGGAIDRCAATAVDPDTGLRDLPVVRTLMQGFGHGDCGVYAEVTTTGLLAESQHLRPVVTGTRPHLPF
jgi:uncharacterized protein